MRKTNARRICLLLMLLSEAISVFWAVTAEGRYGSVVDFQIVYFATRSLFQHRDPYNLEELRQVYAAEQRTARSESIDRPEAVAPLIYLPTIFPIVAPFAQLPWEIAHTLWMILLVGSVFLAVCVMWSLASPDAPGVSLAFCCIALANCEVLFGTGNAAGIAVSLCVIAVWCFLQGRLVPVGVLCLAVSLCIKPNDAGFIWLYFLLAGGVYRKYALQTLALTGALGFLAISWITQTSSHWLIEWQSNLAALSAHGVVADPGPASPGSVIDLQAIVSVFRDDPRIYNPISYLACALFLLVWIAITMRSHISKATAVPQLQYPKPLPPSGIFLKKELWNCSRAWVALAAIAPLIPLLTYHQRYDAKLVLLTIPACAILWTKGDKIGRLAVVMNTAGFILTNDIPAAILQLLARQFHIEPSGLVGRTATILLMRPTSLILLVMSAFYLWIYGWRVQTWQPPMPSPENETVL